MELQRHVTALAGHVEPRSGELQSRIGKFGTLKREAHAVVDHQRAPGVEHYPLLLKKRLEHMREVFAREGDIATGKSLDKSRFMVRLPLTLDFQIEFPLVIPDLDLADVTFHQAQRLAIAHHIAKTKFHARRQAKAVQHQREQKIAGNTEAAGAGIMNRIEVSSNTLGEITRLLCGDTNG